LAIALQPSLSRLVVSSFVMTSNPAEHVTFRSNIFFTHLCLLGRAHGSASACLKHFGLLLNLNDAAASRKDKTQLCRSVFEYLLSVRDTLWPSSPVPTDVSAESLLRLRVVAQAKLIDLADGLDKVWASSMYRRLFGTDMPAAALPVYEEAIARATGKFVKAAKINKIRCVTPSPTSDGQATIKTRAGRTSRAPKRLDL
jgi:hypothetical protein